MKHIHLMGICGTAMASLAGLLKEKGFRITGSDQNPYPPMSTQLETLQIPIQQGYKKENLCPPPDLVIVGNVISAQNEEAQELMRLKIPYMSLPQALAKWVIEDRESIVISGTHGKTTSTSLMAWVAQNVGVSPGFLIGGIAKNFSKSFQNPMGSFFVIEGDEYDTAFFDKVPKFIHYKPKHVILTSLEYDHADIYPTMKTLTDAFEQLMVRIPEDGHLIHWAGSDTILSVIEKTPCQNVYSYDLSDPLHPSHIHPPHIHPPHIHPSHIHPSHNENDTHKENNDNTDNSDNENNKLKNKNQVDYTAHIISYEQFSGQFSGQLSGQLSSPPSEEQFLGSPSGHPLTKNPEPKKTFTHFSVQYRNQPLGVFRISLYGRFNVLNALAVIALSHQLGWDLEKVRLALDSFQGVKRRQELLGEPGGVRVIEDFAHHPTAVKETLDAVVQQYAPHRVYAVFEPRSATSRRRIFQKEYVHAFHNAYETLLAQAYDTSKIPESERFSSEELAADLVQSGKTAKVYSNTQDMIQALTDKVQRGDVILIMSNGGFNGIYGKLISALQSGTTKSELSHELDS